MLLTERILDIFAEKKWPKLYLRRLVLKTKFRHLHSNDILKWKSPPERRDGTRFQENFFNFTKFVLFPSKITPQKRTDKKASTLPLGKCIINALIQTKYSSVCPRKCLQNKRTKFNRLSKMYPPKVVDSKDKNIWGPPYIGM